MRTIDENARTLEGGEMTLRDYIKLAGERIADLQAKLQQADAAVAEMRAILIPMRQQLLTRTAERDKWDHAISTDCGQGWLSPEKARELEHLSATHAADYLREHEKVRVLTEALHRSDQALSDWILCYASEMCDPKDVAAAQSRISNGGGTLAYVTDVQEQNRQALDDAKETCSTK